ncbi:hypothetical protein [Vibrio vulnificus]|uniref:hypothetical protein n=2 Tax=Vibrio TaxID=662 RepID=UPI003C12C4FA
MAFLVCGDFCGESGLQKLGLGGTHPLTQRYKAHTYKVNIGDYKLIMNNLRSATADWITIITGLSTLIINLMPALIADRSVENYDPAWQGHLDHMATTLACALTFYFFIDQSIRVSRRITAARLSVLPDQLVYVFCCLGGLLLFVATQIVFQSYVFDSLQTTYLVVPSIVWCLIMLGLFIAWTGG